MLQLKIKDKIISQGFNQPDVTVNTLRIYSISPIQKDAEAEISVSLGISEQDISGFDNGIVREIYFDGLPYINPDYSNWVKDDDLVKFVCSKLGVELL